MTQNSGRTLVAYLEEFLARPEVALEFNSLDAQREACEAYIKSQAHEGWRLAAADHLRLLGNDAAHIEAQVYQSIGENDLG